MTASPAVASTQINIWFEEAKLARLVGRYDDALELLDRVLVGRCASCRLFVALFRALLVYSMKHDVLRWLPTLVCVSWHVAHEFLVVVENKMETKVLV